MPHLVASISGHGFGHVAMTAPILNLLHERMPQLRITVRSSVPLAHLRARIKAPFTHLSSEGDIGMVITFVGFVGGWVTQVFGPDALFASALAAASVATFFTFLPSFIFIFLGGPFIETTHGNLKLTAPLTAITACVVGVIASLALFFAYHVFWPTGLSATVDGFPALLTAGALLALLRYKSGTIPVILGCGVLGLIWKLLL